MTTYRCPYCRHTFGPELHAECPRCHKTMYVPDTVHRLSFRERKKLHDRIAREADRQRMQMSSTPDGRSMRRPVFVLALALVLAIVGGSLLGKARSVKPQPKPQPKPNPVLLAVEELRIYKAALEEFRQDCRRYPTTAEGLPALIRDPGVSRWRRPYVNIVKPDPWRRRYLYEFSNGVFSVRSLGPDGLKDTGDDLCVDNAEPTPEPVPAPAPAAAPAEHGPAVP